MRRSRPRTRGGHPPSLFWSRHQLASSPHTRGSSGCAGTCRQGATVVPAHAGVIRRSGRRVPWAPCRPRTRGGHPVLSSVTCPFPWSSPHTRGSSRTPRHRCGDRLVVPAHAGVIPPRQRPGRPTRRRPRTRGGHPQSGVGCTRMRVSSPHTRGSSRDRRDQLGGDLRRPRTRGGHPTVTLDSALTYASSPHTRGSSHRYPARQLRQRVVPAHAGVIPACHSIPNSPRSRPRTRGGHPSDTAAPTRTPESSPHTRGSSPEGSHLRLGLAVVPAHAGVIRWCTPRWVR